MGQKGKELSVDVWNMIVNAYRENGNTSELERILGVPGSTIRSIIKLSIKKKANEEEDQAESLQIEIWTNFHV